MPELDEVVAGVKVRDLIGIAPNDSRMRGTGRAAMAAQHARNLGIVLYPSIH
jgi:hypothetical protein